MYKRYGNMYRIDFHSLKNELYDIFIDKAIKRSDTISIKIFRTHILGDNSDEDLENHYKELLENLSDVFDEDEAKEYAKKRIESIKTYNKTLETICYPFLKKLEPFLINASSFDENRCVFLLSAVPEIADVLKEPRKIEKWTAPYGPDDIEFIKENSSWFLSETHESHAYLQPIDDDELRFWKKLGVIKSDATPEMFDWNHYD